MKKILFPLFFALLFVTACDDDDSVADGAPDYKIEIIEPTTDDKMAGNEINVIFNVEDESNGTIHHVAAKIYNVKDSTEVIYEYPEDGDKHVHEEDGLLEVSEKKILDVDGHTDWILEVKAWGHKAGAHEVMETRQFHVHPM